MEKCKNKQIFYETWTAFIATLKSSYKLVPFLVIVLTFVVIAVTIIAITSSNFMMDIVLLIVLSVTIVVYATTGQFGEATLALVAGILTAYSVSWTPSKFIAFIAIWSTFSFLAMMISSLKLASKPESLYRQASIAYAENSNDSYKIEKLLRQISDDKSFQGLGPIERAETLLLFSYRKLPLHIMPTALNAVKILSIITQIEPKVIAVFMSDIFKVFDFVPPKIQDKIIDMVYTTIQKSAVSPIDFINGFEKSRRLVISRSIEPIDFLNRLKNALESGVAPEECERYISDNLNN